MSTRRAVITGVDGQDGSYLAEYLIRLDYKVIGIIRRSSGGPRLINHLCGHRRFHLTECDITEQEAISALIAKTQPDEFYNLAAQSHVGTSFEQPISTFHVDALAVFYMLEAIKHRSPKTRFYQASTSEMFGGFNAPQDENTKLIPQSPYGVAKVAAHEMVRLYRTDKNNPIFACAGILFNHESPRRGVNFLPRKATLGLARVKAGKQYWVEFGNLEAMRDWGDAREYVQAMHLMLQHDHPDDYVIGTGEMHSVRDCINAAAQALGMEIEWRSTGVSERAHWINGSNKLVQQIVVQVNPDFYRPNEVEVLQADPRKAKEELGWEPKNSFQSLIAEMANHDYEEVVAGRL